MYTRIATMISLIYIIPTDFFCLESSPEIWSRIFLPLILLPYSGAQSKFPGNFWEVSTLPSTFQANAFWFEIPEFGPILSRYITYLPISFFRWPIVKFDEEYFFHWQLCSKIKISTRFGARAGKQWKKNLKKRFLATYTRNATTISLTYIISTDFLCSESSTEILCRIFSPLTYLPYNEI